MRGKLGKLGVMTVSFFLRDEEAVTSQTGKFHADPSVAVNSYIQFRFDVEPPTPIPHYLHMFWSEQVIITFLASLLGNYQK
jgi:hypothetical protein